MKTRANYPDRHDDMSLQALEDEFLQFKLDYLEHGIKEGLWTEEKKREILSQPPTSEQQREAEIMDKYFAEVFLTYKLVQKGVITTEQSERRLAKAKRKFGICAQCSNLGTLRCAKCKQAHYCSKECQKAHWATHKKTCTRVL